MTDVAWDKGLPLGILSAVAGGRDELKAMRQVCKNWQQEYEASVSKVTETSVLLLPHDAKQLSHRFPGLTRLQLMKNQMGESSLGSFSSLRKLTDLSLMQKPDIGPQTPGRPLAVFWTDADLLDLHSMPGLTSLHLNGYSVTSCQNLRGLQLASLRMIWCFNLVDLRGLQGMPLRSLSVSSARMLTDGGLQSLRGVPLTFLRLDFCLLLTDSGLEVFRGMPLTNLELCSCNLMTDAGLEVFRGMPLQALWIGYCSNLTPPGCAQFLRGLPLTKLSLLCGPGMLDNCLEVSELG